MERDDLMLDARDAANFLNPPLDEAPSANPQSTSSFWITVEEKIDGANLGIFMDPDNGQLRCVNRGHVVCSESATQFRPLDKYLAEVGPSIYELFELVARSLRLPSSEPESNGHLPVGHEVCLFGEWCVARHSVAYDQLPSYFVVFDLAVSLPRCVTKSIPQARRGAIDPLDSERSSSLWFVPVQRRNELLSQVEGQPFRSVPVLLSQRLSASPTTAVAPKGAKERTSPPPRSSPPPAGNQPTLGAVGAVDWDQIHQLWFKKQSNFSSGVAMEGVVVRMEWDGPVGTDLEGKSSAGAESAEYEMDYFRPGSFLRPRLLRRCKCVRDDFREGIEADGHWSKREMVKNQLAYQ